MTAAPLDPGAIPTSARARAPDLARGGMLLLIALANVQTFLHDRPLGARAYPAVLDALDRAVVLVQMTLVDGRAYPLFGLLFGYGITQLAWRRAQVGMPAPAVERLVRRRGACLVLIGAVHGLLLFSGDIVAAYGLVAVLLPALIVAGADRMLLVAAAVGVTLSALLSTLTALPIPADAAALRSVAVPGAGQAALLRAIEWLISGFALQALAVFGAVALGAWAARRRLLDEPERHRPLLRRVAAGGIGAGALLGLPFGLVAAGLWTVPVATGAVFAVLHTTGGYAAGAGYAALFGLLALRAPGPVTDALVACGRRSLSCYLAQSVAFVALLPAWTAGLGGVATVAQAALVGAGTWLVVLGVAVVSERAGLRGPAEVLLRRLTYGPAERALGRDGPG